MGKQRRFIYPSSEDPFDEVDIDAEILGNPTKVELLCLGMVVWPLCVLAWWFMRLL
jgi:hypothetical protein